ncbi:aliphatic sulfonate ABC transporter substrate-binding protein [Paraburkholderia ginsengiterrae]|uniref:Putative aliphatic sulfonates-binding protein n=1 Tax=Paraburkholderia ginsengiterrae TaxID=1462993 RepID=A0A1A9NDY6_9BURK|nr:sulfonate ABC transporter substrate-binding protein [Paraburkholderia ginsengiterrae]OAJ53933.1 aliphatic sulfonate ABC transporter substrate-binding protein [Paraburkholderia ginsengiterrae]OAJ64727.1 aliphatic sulfonate ABC transporter substrate-binding protein [Paraburkholderia ginsengiterrae]
MSRLPLTRRAFITGVGATLAAATLPVVSTSVFAADARAKEFRIGYQKSANTLVLLKAHGTLEKRLAPLGITVKWTEFPAGPQMLEGLNVGAIDFGYVGEAPPVFAQAAGANFVYVAYEVPTPHAEGILVHHDAPIKTLADLKGKKIAFNKGSDVHWFLVAALKKGGVQYSEIQPVFLAPADARAAFERGAIDAWAIWDPFLEAAKRQSNARLLADGEGIVNHHQFFLGARPFVQQNSDVIAITMDEVGKEGEWVRGHYGEAAAQLAPIQGLDAGVIEAGLRHYAHIYKPIDANVLAEQQHIADTFNELRIIPTKIVTRDAALPGAKV